MVSLFDTAVINGSGNTVTHNYATVSGYAITSVADCAFHANNFVAQNIKCALTFLQYNALQSGELYVVTTACACGARQVFIK